MKIKQALHIGIILLLLSFLIGCSKNESLSESEKLLQSNAVIKPSKLYGKWVVSEMISDKPVNLDNNSSSSTNILHETDCFKDMNIIFNSNGQFSTRNSQMDFAAGTGNDDFKCLDSNRVDRGTWQIEGDKLTLNMSIDEKIYSQTKRIQLNGDKFNFSVSKMESAQYVTDPGTTEASAIRILSIEYKKESE